MTKKQKLNYYELIYPFLKYIPISIYSQNHHFKCQFFIDLFEIHFLSFIISLRIQNEKIIK